jgi:hypothetical protein
MDRSVLQSDLEAVQECTKNLQAQIRAAAHQDQCATTRLWLARAERSGVQIRLILERLIPQLIEDVTFR